MYPHCPAQELDLALCPLQAAAALQEPESLGLGALALPWDFAAAQRGWLRRLGLAVSCAKWSQVGEPIEAHKFF